MSTIRWEPMPTEPEYGPPCPDFCDDGPQSHTWMFSYEAYDGATLWTDECPICNRGANLGDWPLEYLSLDPIPVSIESFTEVFGYYSPEYDHYVKMTPAAGGGTPEPETEER